jgi:putative transposase|tara:strand:+ start:16860 stop:17195 length:336 start_codon:yes stop_codon:yes gene_type:complete
MVDAGLSIVKACLFIGIGHSTFYRSERDWRRADAAVIDAINAVLGKSPRTGFCKCSGLMRFKGFPFNHKRVYCQMGLNFKRRTKPRATQSRCSALRGTRASKPPMGVGLYA